MNTTPWKQPRRWLVYLLVTILVIGSGYLGVTNTNIFALNNQAGSSAAEDETAQLTTVAVQAADVAQTAVSAAGNLALISQQNVALAVDGIVETINVHAGDTVQAGDILLQLDTTDLERSVATAELSVESAKIALADLQTPATASEIAVAEAALLEAQENLAEVQTGPSAEEIAAARSSLAAAQSSYTELTSGPSADELTQLSADLKKSEITLAEAQRAYDQVAWRNDVGMTSEAAELQSATIDYESSKAAYNESTATAGNADLQSAASSIQSAQATLNELLNSPTAAELATSQAQVTDAQATLDELQTGPTNNTVRSAEITLQQALIELETAYRDLNAATLVAPNAGVVLTIDAEVGVRSSADTVVITLGDLSQLELVVSVAESDISRVTVGQAVTVELDALPGQSYKGVVASLTPINDSDSSSVSYPVTIQLTDDDLSNVLPGMNAVATLIDTTASSENSWLVPTNGLVTQGETTTVTVVRNNTTGSVVVTPGSIQGEYTIVQSADLQEGDLVVGSVSSNLESSSGFPGAGMSGGSISGGGAPPSGSGGPPAGGF